jgi:hypothetical protein
MDSNLCENCLMCFAAVLIGVSLPWVQVTPLVSEVELWFARIMLISMLCSEELAGFT